jgi:carbonic anhydrase/acetyltransferase-like protein (isoleucine patch superfamily)
VGRMLTALRDQKERQGAALAQIIPFAGKTPVIAVDAFVAPTAVVIGDVEIGSGASVWFGVVLRGDVGPIRIGQRTNIQDNTVIHLDQGAPAILGDDVTIGHGAIVHGCVVETGAQVGMGAIVLSRAVIGAGSMIGAGAVVPEGMVVPPGSVVMGIPGRIRRDVTPGEREALFGRAAAYSARGARYRETLEEPPPQTEKERTHAD